jgi:hypothetical protein
VREVVVVGLVNQAPVQPGISKHSII